MNKLDEILSIATANIPREYFRLPIDGGGPIYRERVYCYELYHQMRCLWPKDCRFRLNGEVDKAAHPILSRLGASYAKPDLLIHGRGHMSQNHAIIEVKSVMEDLAGVRKDLRTLSLFRTRVGYERAIYLIYGGDYFDRVLSMIEQAVSELRDFPPREFWLHEGAGSSAGRAAILVPRLKEARSRTPRRER